MSERHSACAAALALHARLGHPERSRTLLPLYATLTTALGPTGRHLFQRATPPTPAPPTDDADR